MARKHSLTLAQLRSLDFSYALRTFRLHSGMTQNQLSRALDLGSPTTIHSWESGGKAALYVKLLVTFWMWHQEVTK